MPLTDLWLVMQELADRLQRINGLRTAIGWPGSVSPPVAVVPWPDVDYHTTMGRGSDSYGFEVAVLLPAGADRSASERMRAYLAPEGHDSIRAAVEDDPAPTHADFYRVLKARDFRYYEVGGTAYPGGTWDIGCVVRGTP